MNSLSQQWCYRENRAETSGLTTDKVHAHWFLFLEDKNIILWLFYWHHFTPEWTEFKAEGQLSQIHFSKINLLIYLLSEYVLFIIHPVQFEIGQ